MLLAQFNSSAPKDKVSHSCCDVCAMKCKCLCSCDDSDCSCELKFEQEKHVSRIEKYFLWRGTHTSHSDDRCLEITPSLINATEHQVQKNTIMVFFFPNLHYACPSVA